MRILYVTTISLTMNSFFKPHIEMLVNAGHQVDLACNYSDLELDNLYSELGCNYYQIDFSRSPLSANNIKAYKQLNDLVSKGNYDVVHCHTPNASVITRLVCKKFRKATNLKVFYTAHGFHFYKGAPKLNWIVYYPIEKFCSRYTDKIITINKEDYSLAKDKFYAEEVHYVPGVGIDLSKFKNVKVDRILKRKEIGVPEDAFLLLSVGELNDNKNHQVIIKAMAQIDNPNIHYAIAGEGEKRDYLLNLAKELDINERVHLLGYRKDIPELNCSADAFCFPSIREGLGLAAVEAMACGLPVVVAENRGTKTFVIDTKNGYMCKHNSVEQFEKKISLLMNNNELNAVLSSEGRNTIYTFSIENVLEKMAKLYK